jgi:dynein heavy chain
MFSGVPGFDDDIDLDPRTKLPKKVDWNACKKLMNNPQRLVDSLKKYPEQINQNLVPKQNFQKVKEVLAKEHMQDIERIGKMNAAAGSVLAFVVGMVEVYDAYMDLIPRRNALAEANQKLAEATEKLVKVKEFVAILEAELSVLVAKFNEANDSKNKALAEAESCQLRLSLANRLIKALSSEKVRWGDSIVRLGEDLKVIVGDVLLASSFVSYVGP